MAPGAERREVLRYLQAADLGFHTDVRDLERTITPRKSKPGTAEALIDDLIEWRTWDEVIMGADFSGDLHPGEAAFWKLAEMGFDAVPALLDHLHDSRFTRHPAGEHDGTGFEWTLFTPTHVGELARRLVNHFAGECVIGMYPDERDAHARAWWEKARKVGEEKWLVAHALPEVRPGDLLAADRPNRVILRTLGAKYPRRLAELYRSVLRAPDRSDGAVLALETRVLALEIVASRLPREEKLALLVEGAEHEHLAHRIAALAVLVRVDAPTFRKHLLAALKNPPEGDGWWVADPRAELASLVWLTDDPACWTALTALTQRVKAGVRSKILREFTPAETDYEGRSLGRLSNRPDPAARPRTERELIRYLVRFLSDESVARPDAEDDEDQPRERVADVAAVVLAERLGVEVDTGRNPGALARLFVRAAVWQAAQKHLAAGKK
jgi:hypothetical protein